MSTEIHLLRHADAGDPGAWRGDDALRPLSDKGRGQAERLASWLGERRFDPGAIVTSPKLRASQTAEILASGLGREVVVEPRLGGPLGISDLDDIVRRHASGGRVVLVGHDPDFSDLAAALIGAGRLPLKKAAICRIDVDGTVREGAGALRWLVPPSLLRMEDQS